MKHPVQKAIAFNTEVYLKKMYTL